MAQTNNNKHLTAEDRKIIETGICNDSNKVSIANTLGKDKSTIGKEIKLHRSLVYKCSMPLECQNYRKCKYERSCTIECPEYKPFKCGRRDRSPGACNGCKSWNSCRFSKYKYSADIAENEYTSLLASSREGINTNEENLKKLGLILKPYIDRGVSIYSILQFHPEIEQSEKTIYTYINDGIFRNAGILIRPIDMKRMVSRKITKKDSNVYKERKDRTYLKDRLYEDYLNYIKENPNAKICQMDTVYNHSSGPFMQTFKFLAYSIMIILFRETRTALDMYNGILLLETILGPDIFRKEAEILLTDRGSEFTMSEDIEKRDDGSRRTRIFYCDPMASGQKGSLEVNHEDIRLVFPKGTDLIAMGFVDQKSANTLSSHLNSYPKEKLEGKTPFQFLEFLNPAMAQRLRDFGISEIAPDKVLLKPYLLKK